MDQLIQVLLKMDDGDPDPLIQVIHVFKTKIQFSLALGGPLF